MRRDDPPSDARGEGIPRGEDPPSIPPQAEGKKIPGGSRTRLGEASVGGGKVKVPNVVWTIIRHLLEGQLLAGLALLREQIASDEYHAAHARKRQIERVEEVFRKTAVREPWPADLQPSELIHWRGKLGALLGGLPLAKILEDLKATAAGKRNLLYYLSAEKGKRASRWEMRLCDHREQIWKEEKRRERQDAEKFFGNDERGMMNDEKLPPEWVRKLKKERERCQWLLEQEVDGEQKRAATDRIRQIDTILSRKT